MGKTVSLNPLNPDAGTIASAADVIQAGGMVIFPTRSLYGIAVDAFNRSAVECIFEAKKRSRQKAILLLIPDISTLDTLTEEIPATAGKLMNAFWPGNLTLLFKANQHIPELVTAGTGKIGIRLPAHPVGAALVRHVGSAITGTSANLSGGPGAHAVDQLPPAIIDAADLILDAGELKPGIGSTIVDVSGNKPVILREGTISREKIRNTLNWRASN